MDKLRSMEVFVSVADLGSFTAAAQHLDMSTVMVSKHIAQLETTLAVRLLNRTTRSLSLTEIGETYLEQCRQILQAVLAAETGTQTMRATPRGLLKLSAPVAFGSTALAPTLADYLTAHSEVQVDLDLSNRLADIVEEGLDAVVRIGKLDDSALIARPLRPFKMIICAAPDYLKRYGTPHTPADLAQHECLDFLHWRRTTRWKLQKEQEPSNAAPARFRSNNGPALKNAAIAGLGLLMQAEIVLTKDIQEGKLIPVLEHYLPDPKPMNLIYPRHRQSTPKIASFVEFVVERFGLK
jgi:DNA-binding transcriptional LysR family regulator